MKSNKRNPGSLFDQVCQFINSQEIGSTFYVYKLYNSVTENLTPWKARYKDHNYATRLYAGLLRNAGVLVKNKRETWTVLAHVPDNVTLDKISPSNTPWDQLWKANKTITVANTPIIIFKIVDKHVEPADVYANQVSALLSTGDYFEDEMDAWYFLSVGLGYAIEDLKAKWKAEQELANTIVEETESQLEQEEREIIERLDGLLPIITLSDAQNTKIIYGFNGENGPLTKAKVSAFLVVANDEVENESLKRLLQLKAGSKLPWTVLAEDILEKIENEIFEIEDKKVVKVPTMKLIEVEDIRNKEVYFINNGGLIQKGRVESFGIDCPSSGDKATIYDIEVLIDGRIETFDGIEDLIFSKEELKAKLNKIVESL